MYSNKIDASSDNIPTTFDTSDGSLIINGAPSSGIIYFLTTCQAVLSFCIAPEVPTTVPESSLSTNPNQGWIPAAPEDASAGVIIDYFKIKKGDKVYVRSDSGSAVSSGILRVTLL